MPISRPRPAPRAACSIFIRIPDRPRCRPPVCLRLLASSTWSMAMPDKPGTVRMAHDGNGLRPEIDRGALRNLLLSSLPPDLVRWNAQVTGIDREESGFKLSFADGSVAPAKILVGADGAWSKV